MAIEVGIDLKPILGNERPTSPKMPIKTPNDWSKKEITERINLFELDHPKRELPKLLKTALPRLNPIFTKF